MAQLSNQDGYIKTALRLPRALHVAVQQAATTSGRSMNAEIIHLLEQGVGGAAEAQDLVITLTCGPTIQVAELKRLIGQVREALGDLPVSATFNIKLDHGLPVALTLAKHKEQ